MPLVSKPPTKGVSASVLHCDQICNAELANQALQRGAAVDFEPLQLFQSIRRILSFLTNIELSPRMVEPTPNAIITLLSTIPALLTAFSSASLAYLTLRRGNICRNDICAVHMCSIATIKRTPIDKRGPTPIATSTCSPIE